MELNQILAALGLTEADLDAISQSGVYDENAGLLNQQQALAQQMRGTPLPEGRNIGGTFQAANPLEFVGATLQRMKGERQADEVLGQQKSLIELLRQGLKTGAGVGMAQAFGPNPPPEAPYYLKPNPY